MPNLDSNIRLNTELVGETRARLESELLPYKDWGNHPEMPKPCWDVVTGDAFYCGGEGIGKNTKLGWFLLLKVPCDHGPHCQHDGTFGTVVQRTYKDNKIDKTEEIQEKYHFTLLFAEHPPSRELDV